MDLLIVNRGGYQNGFEVSKDCLILGRYENIVNKIKPKPSYDIDVFV